jgi:glycosyltransferase involved in cell wall biosynthesis
MHKPLVSIVGTSFSNTDKQIKKCISSLKKQNYKNLEFIFVLEPNQKNNKIFFNQKKKIKNLKIFVNKKKLGFVKSLSKAVNYSRGEYISRVDFDDYYDETKILKQVILMEKNKHIGVCGTSLFLVGNLTIKKKKFPRTNFFIKLYFFFFNSIAHSSAVIRTSVLKKYGSYNAFFKYSEDLEMWLRFFSKKVMFYNLPEPLTYYNVTNRLYLRSKNNFIYNLKARKKYSRKIYGSIFGKINIKIFEIFITNFFLIQKTLNKIVKL